MCVHEVYENLTRQPQLLNRTNDKFSYTLNTNYYFHIFNELSRYTPLVYNYFTHTFNNTDITH